MKEAIEKQTLFGAEIIRYTSVDEMLVSAPNLIVYAAPLMFLFVLIEYFFSRFHNHNLYEKKETIGSVIVGVGNVVIGLFIKTVLFIVFITVYNWVPWRMELPGGRWFPAISSLTFAVTGLIVYLIMSDSCGVPT